MEAQTETRQTLEQLWEESSGDMGKFMAGVNHVYQLNKWPETMADFARSKLNEFILSRLRKEESG